MLTLDFVEKHSGLTRASFKQTFLDLKKPVILTDLMDDWLAKEKWTVPFFKHQYGDLQVPLYSKKTAQPGKGYLQPEIILPLREYLDMMEEGPLDLRMFLFNIFKHAPELMQDFSPHSIMDGFIDRFPFLFFGGEGSRVGLHYDIDLSHVFLNQLHGRKRVILFAPDQSKNVYRHPFTVASFIDTQNPDYKNFPALKNAKGYDCILQPGETLFIPCGYWHSVEYLDGGYSISLRANESIVRRAKGLFNIASHFVVDRSMNRLMGQNWRTFKAGVAKRRAEV